MKLYDFSYFARRRDAERAAQAVAEVDVSKPGAVIELKKRISTWFNLRKDDTKRTA